MLEWVTAGLALLALIISTLSLWFTSLKGPDIVLCEEPDIAQEGIATDTFSRIVPDTIFCKTHLVFLNNGTVSGVLRLEAHFEPEKELVPFFKRSRFSLSIDGGPPQDVISPVSIGEKESRIISVNLTVELHDWKEYFSHEPVSRDEIHTVLCQAGKQNRRLSDFCTIMRTGMHWGKLSIRSYQTKRKYLFWTGMRQKDLVHDRYVGVLDEKLVKGFESCLRRWDNINRDAILVELGHIHELVGKLLLDPIDQNVGRLAGVTDLVSLETDLYDTLKSRCEGYGSRMAIVNFILRSIDLDSRLREYASKTREWNRKLNLLRENPLNPRLDEALRKDTHPLTKESHKISVEIASIQKMLQECYLPSS